VKSLAGQKKRRHQVIGGHYIHIFGREEGKING